MAVRYRVAIRSAEDRWPTRSGGPSAVEQCVVEHWPGHKVHGLPASTAPGPQLEAFVVHGRWMVQCPGCPSATLASRKDHRFFCTSCSSALDGGRWLPVVWPDDWEAIERLLGARPDRRNRNWLPGETVADLLAENVANGVI